jgi:hypothetical protein
VEVNQLVLFASSLEILPSEVLQDIIDGKKIKYMKKVELISIVCFIYLMVFDHPWSAFHSEKIILRCEQRYIKNSEKVMHSHHYGSKFLKQPNRLIIID